MGEKLMEGEMGGGGGPGMALSSVLPRGSRSSRQYYNFSAGPAVLPEAVLARAATEWMDWKGTGISVMEMSHRSAQFEGILSSARADLVELLSIPDEYEILWMQGGGLTQHALVPMNLNPEGRAADYLVTGYWSCAAATEASRYCPVNVVEYKKTPSLGGTGFPRHIPKQSDWILSDNAAYLHLCSNETIDGIQFREPISRRDVSVPVVVDASSDFLSGPMDVSAYGCVFASAQKNLGLAGLVSVILRKDLLRPAHPACPKTLSYAVVATHQSLYNTPPTFAIYMAGLILRWLLDCGGLCVVAEANRHKAALLYDVVDQTGFYYNDVDPACRSLMNVPFFLRDPSLQETFLVGAEGRGLLSLKGHRSVGGFRASIYNAMPMEGVAALVDYMRDFERRYG